MPEKGLSPEERAGIDALYNRAVGGTFFDLLGVSPDTDSKTAQTAFYDLARKWHPDRFFRRDMGEYRERLETVFALMTRAHQTLSDDTARTRYMRDLAESGIKLGKPPPLRKAPAPKEAPPQPQVQAPKIEGPMPPGEDAPVYEVSLGTPPAAPAGAPRGEPQRAPPPDSPMRRAIREQVRERLERARRYYLSGKEDFDAGRYLQAATHLKLAVEFDPKSAEYKHLMEQAQLLSKGAQADYYLSLAKKADEGFNEQAAIVYLKKAIEHDVQDAAVFYRLGKWMLDKEKDQRGAIANYRKAVERKPESIEYRLALADLYALIKMDLNARREYQAVLDRDKKNERARKALAKL